MNFLKIIFSGSDTYKINCKYIFLGYSRINQYRLWDPEKKDIIITKNIKFDKSRIINNLNLETLEINNELNNKELIIINTDDEVNFQ